MSDNPLTVIDVSVKRDKEGRYNLNDLHKASGGKSTHQPSNWLRGDTARGLAREISRSSDLRIASTSSVSGGNNSGTFVAKEMVYAYAMWISASFSLKVIRAFDQLQTDGVAVADHAADDILENPLDYMEKLIGQARKLKHERDIAATRIATYEKVTAQHDHTLTRYIRTLDGVNSQHIKKDLEFFGYLYKTKQTYKRYARFDHLFKEKIDGEYGTVQIVPTALGKQLLIDLYERGALTLKKAFQ